MEYNNSDYNMSCAPANGGSSGELVAHTRSTSQHDAANVRKKRHKRNLESLHKLRRESAISADLTAANEWDGV